MREGGVNGDACQEDKIGRRFGCSRQVRVDANCERATVVDAAVLLAAQDGLCAGSDRLP